MIPPRPRSRLRLAIAVVIALPLAVFFIAALHGLIDIRLQKKQPSTLLFDRSYKFIAAIENSSGGFGYWEMPDTLPQNLVTATLAAEDRRFKRHFGIDLLSTGRAFVDNYLRKNGHRGASTIAMQVARLQRGGGSGWYNKVHDAVAGMGLTVFYGRSAVLRHYFRIAPYGNRIAGAACASRRYFHKPVMDLSLAEAALLASIPKAPSRFNLFKERGLRLAKRRAKLIVTRAYAYGWISTATEKETLVELATFTRPSKEIRNESCLHFLHACSKNLAAHPDPRGEIRTTLDMVIQDTLLSILRNNVPQLLKWEAGNAAAMVVDVQNGEVLAYIGAYNYYDPRGGAIDCAALSRSTGSLLKPFIYALGMEWQGYTAATTLTDLGFDFGNGRRSFVPENFDRRFMGPVLYKNALANSRNIPAVQVLKAVGVDMFYSLCIDLGLAGDNGMAQQYGLGLSIGGLYCSLRQLCAAYLTLANNGEKHDLVWKISDLEADTAPGRRIIPPDIAMQIKRFLSDPVARLPSFPRGGNLEYPFAVAVKTGTSEGFRDSWCIGFSDRYLVGVWMGNTDFSATKNLTGFEGAARIVKETMIALHPNRTDGLKDIGFPPPPGYVPVQICRLTGKKADRFTPYVTTEYFRPGTEPLEYSTVQQLLPVDKTNGLLAYPGCNVPVEYRRFIVLAPMFHDWAESQGLEVPPDRYSPACGNSPIVDSYAIDITSPRSGSRFFIDPEMPDNKSFLPLICNVFPPPASVLWMLNGEEHTMTKYPFKLLWPMKPGKFEFQAVVPGTPFKSRMVQVEVF